MFQEKPEQGQKQNQGYILKQQQISFLMGQNLAYECCMCVYVRTGEKRKEETWRTREREKEQGKEREKEQGRERERERERMHERQRERKV